MPIEKYDILTDTFCLYCQRDFPTPEAMQAHVEKKHPGTHAYVSIERARQEQGD
jgi:hypothetical protein